MTNITTKRTDNENAFNKTKKQKVENIENDEAALDDKARTHAENIMSKYEQNIIGNKSWLVRTIKEVVETVEEDLNFSQFTFEDTMNAAEGNANVLKKYDYDFEKATKNEPNTILTPGSEFRHIKHIEKLWKFRYNWEEIKSILTNG